MAANAGYTDVTSYLKGLTKGDFEAGRSFTYKDGVYTFTSHDGLAGGTEINWTPTSSNPIDGFMHTHYDGLYPIFSSADLLTPYKWYKSGGIKDLKTFRLDLITSEGIYYLSIYDQNLYKVFAEKYTSDTWKEALEFLYYYTYRIDVTTAAGTAMSALVRLLTDCNSGMKLMKQNNSSASSGNPISAVYVDSSGKIVEINCD